ncbi:MAG TPA: metalloregulator ArsR/SmtB family transcription factor [Kofleriaceae bacterium]|jgi:DNA-binding transcriptional ArsR family regulator
MQLDATLIALADPTRRAVVDLLRHGPRRAGELSDALGMTAPAMSRHLKVLRTTGLVEPAFDDTDARAKIYRLKRERFIELRDWLADVDRFWTNQLANFADYAERTRREGSNTSTARSPRGRNPRAK